MDRITQSYVKEFLKLQEIPSKADDVDFEKFVNFTIVSREYSGQFKIDDISTGTATGIDGVAVIVNGKLVNSIDEVNDLCELNRYLEVMLVFCQAKTSSNFSGSEMVLFALTVKELFLEKPSIVLNEELQQVHSLIQHIYDMSPRMTKGKPKCKLYFVTTGNWVGDQNLNAIIDNGERELVALNLFSEVAFEPCDASLIQRYYSKTKERITATFAFKDKVLLPDAKGIKEAYFGLLPFDEFMKIICDDNGKIKNIFDDNIRDYLGENPINDKIVNTLNDDKFNYFSMLNNGVTVVTNELTSSANRFTITDYQVVNGCQTSHVLFHNKHLTGIEKITIPFRLISTDNDDIKNEVTIATNSQNAIKLEQLEALSAFHRGLEQYYNTFSGDGRLYYERRTNQYSTDDTIIKTKMVSIPTQIKAFSSMFLDLPHQASRYYGTIIKNVSEQFFRPDHKYSPYYVSAFALYRLEFFFRNGTIDAKYKKCKYHMLAVFRRLVNQEQMPNFNSGKMEGYCTPIATILNDSSKALNLFLKVTEIIDAAGIDVNNADKFKQKEVIETLIKMIPK